MNEEQQDQIRDIMALMKELLAVMDSEGNLERSEELWTSYTCVLIEAYFSSDHHSLWERVLHAFVARAYSPFLPEDPEGELSNDEKDRIMRLRRRKYLEYVTTDNNFEKMLAHVRAGTPRSETGVPEF